MIQRFIVQTFASKSFIMDIKEFFRSHWKVLIYILIFIFIFIILPIIIDLITHGEISGGTFGVGSRPGGGRGSSGGRGSGGGCFSSDTMIWTKNESASDTYATEVKVKDVIEGHLVGTLDTSVENAGHYNFMWTRATDVTIYHGIFKAHNFSFSSGHHITVTSPHLMMVLKDGKFFFSAQTTLK